MCSFLAVTGTGIGDIALSGPGGMCIKSSKSKGIEYVRLSGNNGDNVRSSSSSISGSNGMTKTCSGDAFGVE